MFRTAEYQRGYDAGYKQALRDALKDRGFDPTAKIGGPDAPYKQRPPYKSID